jgi:hypothetical protein
MKLSISDTIGWLSENSNGASLTENVARAHPSQPRV